MKRNLLKKLLLSAALGPLMHGAYASGTGDEKEEIKKRMATAPGASSATASSATPLPQTSFQNLDLASQNVLGKYDLFLGYNDFIRSNPSEIARAASNLRQAKTAFKDARVHSQEWTQGLSLYLQELIKGNMTALEHVAKNTGDYARLMPHVFGEERSKHWQGFYEDVHYLKQQTSEEQKILTKFGLASKFYNAIPQGPTYRDSKERRLYVERALGLVTPQDLKDALQKDITTLDSQAARYVIMTVCEHITIPATSIREKKEFIQRDIFKPMTQLALYFLLKKNHVQHGPFILDKFQIDSFVFLIFLATNILASELTSVDKTHDDITLLERMAEEIPPSHEDIVKMTLAKRYLEAHFEFPENFPTNSEKFKSWFDTAQLILKQKNTVYADNSEVLEIAAWIQYHLSVNKDFLHTHKERFDFFDLRMKSLEILSKTNESIKNRCNTEKEIEIYLALLNHNEDAKERQKILSYLSSDIPPHLKRSSNNGELLAHLSRGFIKDIPDIHPTVPPTVLNVYAQLIKTGQTSTNINGNPISSRNKYKAAAALFIQSGTSESRKELYEMLMTGQLQEAELLQILSNNKVDLEGPMNPTKLIQELRQTSPYYQALFHFYRAQNTVGDVLIDLTKALEYLEECDPNPQIDQNKDLISSLLSQKTQTTKIDSQETPSSQEIVDNPDLSSDDSEDTDDSEKAPQANKGKWKTTPANFLSSTERLRLAIAQSKPLSLVGVEHAPEQLTAIGAKIHSPLAQEDYEKLTPLQKGTLVEIIQAISAGDTLRGMETLKGFKPIESVPFNKGIEIKSVPIEGVHRLVYSQEGSKITVYRCYGHYDDNIPGVKQ